MKIEIALLPMLASLRDSLHLAAKGLNYLTIYYTVGLYAFTLCEPTLGKRLVIIAQSLAMSAVRTSTALIRPMF